MTRREAFKDLEIVVLWHLAEERQEEKEEKSTIAFGKFYDNATKDTNSDMLWNAVEEFNKVYSDKYHAVLEHGDKYNYVQVSNKDN